jgi:hypothetical protein
VKLKLDPQRRQVGVSLSRDPLRHRNPQEDHTMKPVLIAVLASTAALSAGAAFAGDKCNMPVSEWRPRQELEKKMLAEGWKIKELKTDDGCYEIYGTDAQGRRVEAYFDPKTFKIVKLKAK